MERPAYSTLVGRALRLRCPRCGEAPMFLGLFRMHERCGHCRLKFEREPGYFLGSIYINYGWTALSTTIAYILLRFVYDFSAQSLLIPFSIYCVVFPACFFRYARALWLAMDCQFDATIYSDWPPAPAESNSPVTGIPSPPDRPPGES